ncbi:MAG: InlB B-repeat-containing protein, partial [Firmicutes bacterium]|nr:InlB B-repeat-containing protein [Bacillota bacterium]
MQLKKGFIPAAGAVVAIFIIALALATTVFASPSPAPAPAEFSLNVTAGSGFVEILKTDGAMDDCDYIVYRVGDSSNLTWFYDADAWNADIDLTKQLSDDNHKRYITFTEKTAVSPQIIIVKYLPIAHLTVKAMEKGSAQLDYYNRALEESMFTLPMAGLTLDLPETANSDEPWYAFVITPEPGYVLDEILIEGGNYTKLAATDIARYLFSESTEYTVSITFTEQISPIETIANNNSSSDSKYFWEDWEIAQRFVVDDMHAAEYCTENAVTVREFAPNSIYTYGVVDPFFEKGGTQFFPTNREVNPTTGVAKAKIYVIAVDFTDLKGDVGVPYGVQRNIFINQNSVYDLSNPEIIYEATFFGSDGFTGKAGSGYKIFSGNGTKNGLKNIAANKFSWGTTDPTQNFKGLVQIINEVSLGTMEIEVECLNKRLTEKNGKDANTDKWEWFHLDGPMIGYAVQGPADCEDYRQFARLHQAAIDKAYEEIAGLDLEDIDLIYTIVPISAFGHRSGLQGGGGLDTSFSFNDQALLQRESEFRHKPGVTTKAGRIVGSGVFGIKNLWSSGNPRSAVSTSVHEFLHGMGGFDDYYYGWMPMNNGESVSSAVYYNNVGESSPGSRFGGDTQDLTTWRKYRQGWVANDEIKVILPGDKEKLKIRASASFAGDGGNYTNDPAIKTRMVIIPKEWRTRDTFGYLWDNGWNPKKTDYNWYDWFTNPWVGGVTRAIKSWATFYTVECRKQLGADNTMSAANQGIVVSMLANPTWETGHGGGGWKLCSGSTGLKAGTTWKEPNLGLTITVESSNVFYDEVTIDYTGVAEETVNSTYPGPAQHVYQGVLTASESFILAGEACAVDFDLFTLGISAINDIQSPTTIPVSTAPYNNGVVRVATPLGVPGGIAGFKMEITFDAGNFDFIDVESDCFACTVDDTAAATGKLVVTGEDDGNGMIDKDIILSANFKAKAGAVTNDYQINGKITDVTLLNWRGDFLHIGDPGFDGVGTICDDKGVMSLDPLADLYKCSRDGNIINYYDYTSYIAGIFSKGGVIHVGSAPLYNISGAIVCDTVGPVAGTFIGVEADVKLYDKNDAIIATTTSDWDGNYSIAGIPAATGYYIEAEKPKYTKGKTASFDITTGDVAVPQLQLARRTFNVSGTIKGGVKSDGSDAIPLSGYNVYIINIGNAYKVLGGPYTTDANGDFSGAAIIETWNKPFAAIAVDVTGKGYSPQMLVGGLELNLGSLYGIDPSDRIYPLNTSTYGVGGGYNFLLDKDTTGRNITLTKNQEIHIRIATKSTEVQYQLKNIDGTNVGAPLQSVGTANGDDVLQNIEPGSYYIEVSRDGYMSACTIPFTVDATRIFLRNAPTTNTFDLVAKNSTPRLTGTVYDLSTGGPLENADVTVIPYAATRGKGAPILTDDKGEFDYPDTGGEKYLLFSKTGYSSQTISLASGAASGIIAELIPDGADTITVTFNPSGGNLTTTTKTVVVDGVYGLLPIPTKRGYVFEGWYTLAEGGTEVVSTTKVASDAINHSIYAHWEEDGDTVVATVFEERVYWRTEEGTLAAPKTGGILGGDNDSISNEDIECVDTRASVQFYSNSAFTTRATEISLAASGITPVYFTVTAADKLTVFYYQLNVVRGETPPVGNTYLQENLIKYPDMYDYETGQTRPIFTQSDGGSDTGNTRIIQEEVWIEVPCDVDKDGKRDLIRARFKRPLETKPEYGGLKTPVIAEVTPYVTTFGSQGGALGGKVDIEYPGADNPDTRDLTYADLRYSGPRYKDLLAKGFGDLSEWGIPDARVPIGTQAEGNITAPPWANSGRAAWQTLFIPLGYTTAHVTIIGSDFGEGFLTYGDYAENLCAAALVDWLNGRIKGYSSPTSLIEVLPPYWATGEVAMAGQSYNGTLPFAAAITGVEGLRTIIPFAPVTSSYEYYRSNGSVYSPGNCQGEDVSDIIGYCFGRGWAGWNSGIATSPVNNTFNGTAFTPPMTLYERFYEHVAEAYVGQDRTTGDYNAFWDARNQASFGDDIRKDLGMILFHGFNDNNVKFKNTALIYDMADRYGITAKAVFHQGMHMSPLYDAGLHFYPDIHKWFDYYLYGVENGMPDDFPDVRVQSNVDISWTEYDKWPMGKYLKFYPNGTERVGTLAFTAQRTPKNLSLEDDFTFSLTRPTQTPPAGTAIDPLFNAKAAEFAGHGVNQMSGTQNSRWRNYMLGAGDKTDAWTNNWTAPSALELANYDLTQALGDRLLYAMNISEDMIISGTIKMT